MPEIREADRWEQEWRRYQKALRHIEIRSFDREYGGDEIVAKNATVHLEQMDDSNYFLGIYVGDEFVQVSIGSDTGRAKVRAVIYGGGTL